MNTLFRIINAVFTGDEFQSVHEKIGFDQIYEQLEGIPYQLSIEQKKAVLNALTNDVSYGHLEKSTKRLIPAWSRL